MRRYGDSLVRNGYDVEIVNYADLRRKRYTDWIIKKYELQTIHIVDVVDFELKKRIELASKSCRVSIKWYDNPNFLLSQTDVSVDFSGKVRHSMANFYKKQRRRHNILIESDGKPVGGIWSYDSENRKKLPRDFPIPYGYTFRYKSDEIQRAETFVEDFFSLNYGITENFNYPVDHNQAAHSLEDFLLKKFKFFGPYEDAISKVDSTLFHSVLTPYMNIGLINPAQVISKISDFAKDHKIPVNSYEGFIRQIIGWREFIRGIYIVDGGKQRTKNYWNFNRKMPDSFYQGSTNIEPIDVTIKKLLRNSYLHHIERLMVLGNMLFLIKIDPNSVYKLFMELFIDAYDWVMVPNVYGMSQFSDGGLMSTKPYISGSNYILKMSDYKKGDWCNIWDALYWNFIDGNREFFRKNPRTSMMINMYDKKPKDMKFEYVKTENTFLHKLGIT